MRGLKLSLQVLSIDYDIVSNAFLQTLESAADLKRLVVHINGVSKDHPGTTDDAWLKFRSQHQNCELRVTLIHAYKEVKYLERILKSCMPLTHLKVFFCEYVSFFSLTSLFKLLIKLSTRILKCFSAKMQTFLTYPHYFKCP